MRAPHGEVARRIAQAFLLFVRGIMLFVDHDQFQARQRSEHCQPRAEHDAGLSQVAREPAAQALAFGQAAMQRGHRQAGKTAAHVVFELRRQVDFRHQDQDLRIGVRRQAARDRLQIDFGLAAAGHAIEQHGRIAAGVGNRFDRLELLGIEAGGAGNRGIRCGACRELGELLQGLVERRGLFGTQALGQAGQRHLAQRALVIVGGETAQIDPGAG